MSSISFLDLFSSIDCNEIFSLLTHCNGCFRKPWQFDKGTCGPNLGKIFLQLTRSWFEKLTKCKTWCLLLPVHPTKYINPNIWGVAEAAVQLVTGEGILIISLGKVSKKKKKILMEFSSRGFWLPPPTLDGKYKRGHKNWKILLCISGRIRPFRSYKKIINKIDGK